MVVVQVHAGSVTSVTESTNPSMRLGRHRESRRLRGCCRTLPYLLVITLSHRKSLHACITFSATSTLPHRYLPTVLAYSAPGRLQDCSTSHPTSANHLRGRANLHPSHETHPSRPIKEVSRATHPLTIRAHGRPSAHACKYSFGVVGNYCMNQVGFSATRTSKIGHTFVVH